MNATYRRITRRKLWGLRLALLAFLAGALCLGGLIVAILWNP